MLSRATFNVLHYSEHHFEPQGWTALWLLGESHLAIHTFPEHRTAYLELSSCMYDKYCCFLVDLEQLLQTVETMAKYCEYPMYWLNQATGETGQIKPSIFTS